MRQICAKPHNYDSNRATSIIQTAISVQFWASERPNVFFGAMQRTSTGAPEPRAKCAIFADFRSVLVLTGIGVVRHLRAGVRTVGSELDRNTRVAERGPGAALGERKADDPR